MRKYYDNTGKQVGTSRGSISRFMGAIWWLVGFCFIIGAIHAII